MSDSRDDFAALAFVGDALSAAGYRLAGVQTFAPQAGEEKSMLAQARAVAAVVFVTPEIAAQLPPAELDHALAAGSPLLAIVPPLDAAPPPFDPAERVCRQLGLER